MKSFFAVVVACALALPAWAGTEGEVTASGPKVSTLDWVGTVALASGVSVATSGLGGALAFGVPSMCLAHDGVPRPWCTAVGVTLAAGAQVLLGVWLVPELFRLVGADPATTRAGLWRWARWPALAMAASTLAIIVGSFIEQRQYGVGQPEMAAGLVGVSLGGVTFDVLEVFAAARAAQGR